MKPTYQHMKKRTVTQGIKLVVIFTMGLASLSHAALPPQYQNDKDLNAMVSFAKQHELIMMDLKNINIENKTITYGYYDGEKTRECIAAFTRKAVSFKGPGPAGDLIFDKSDCPLTWKKP